MGDLRLKAQEILKLRKIEKEKEAKNRELSLEELIEYKRAESKYKFTENINQEINSFQVNLLEAANEGEALKIDILEIEKDQFSDSSSFKVLVQYLPVEHKIVTFLDDTNFDFIADEIIVDETLNKLYQMIVDYDIYPIWRTRVSADNKKQILYLEVNPLNNYADKKSEIEQKIEKRRKMEQHAVVLYTQNLENQKKERKRARIRRFLLAFAPLLYISVVILTVLSSAIGLLPTAEASMNLGMLSLGWPYFIFTSFQGAFLFSLPIGLALSLYFAIKKS